MIKDLFTAKSFLLLGDSLKTCFNCDYCRANDDNEYHFLKLPSEINPIFKNLPISVNLFYGDPTLQWENTINILKKLENSNHKGVITIITKGKLPTIPKMNIDLHVGISIGPDKISQDNLEYNLKISNNSWYKYNIEYRPICKNINDSDEMIEYIISKANEYNTCISYSGLQLPPKTLDDKYIPYGNRPFSSQKYISKDIENKIKNISRKYNVPIFKKTSCLISFMHNYNYDYNAHYLKPLDVNCKNCPLFYKCNNFSFNTTINLPFKFTIEHNSNYLCSFVKNGLCKFPNKECYSMTGSFIIPKLKEITRGDARVIKWLTGCMVDKVDNLIESPYLSDFWKTC